MILSKYKIVALIGHKSKTRKQVDRDFRQYKPLFKEVKRRKVLNKMFYDAKQAMYVIEIIKENKRSFII